MNNITFIYLHGFASSPNSSKAKFFEQKLIAQQQKVIVPDLNLGDFTHITLTKQINYLTSMIKSIQTPIITMGSSMGGITSAILAETHPQIIKQILFAPAFKLKDLWLNDNTLEEIKSWHKLKTKQVMHYGYNQEIDLDYAFCEDLKLHDYNLKRNLPTLIFHGIHDEVVPVSLSREYASEHSLTKLIELDDDHSVGKNLPDMWLTIKQFI
jgi:predicted esterase YcpF (UPF0227 family)